MVQIVGYYSDEYRVCALHAITCFCKFTSTFCHVDVFHQDVSLVIAKPTIALDKGKSVNGLNFPQT